MSGSEVFNLESGAVLYRRAFNNGELISSAVLSPDGGVVAFRHVDVRGAPAWEGIRLLDPVHQRITAEFADPDGLLGNPAAFTPDGSLLFTTRDDGQVLLIDLATGAVVHQWQAHVGTILNLAVSPDGRYIATSGQDGFIRIWGAMP